VWKSRRIEPDAAYIFDGTIGKVIEKTVAEEEK